MAQMHPGFASMLKHAHVEREGDTAFFLDDEGRPVVWMDWDDYEELMAEEPPPPPKSQSLVFLERFGLQRSQRTPAPAELVALELVFGFALHAAFG
jgi:hypothetical protein